MKPWPPTTPKRKRPGIRSQTNMRISARGNKRSCSMKRSSDRQPGGLRLRLSWRGTGGGSSQGICGVLPGAQSPSAGVQYGAAHGRGHAPSPCGLYTSSHGAEPGPFYQGFHETGVKAAGLCGPGAKADGMERLDGA